MASKKEKVTAQYDEICELFQRLQVCPSGARCQNLHLYQDLENDKELLNL